MHAGLPRRIVIPLSPIDVLVMVTTMTAHIAFIIVMLSGCLVTAAAEKVQRSFYKVGHQEVPWQIKELWKEADRLARKNIHRTYVKTINGYRTSSRNAGPDEKQREKTALRRKNGKILVVESDESATAFTIVSAFEWSRHHHRFLSPKELRPMPQQMKEQQLSPLMPMDMLLLDKAYQSIFKTQTKSAGGVIDVLSAPRRGDAAIFHSWDLQIGEEEVTSHVLLPHKSGGYLHARISPVGEITIEHRHGRRGNRRDMLSLAQYELLVRNDLASDELFTLLDMKR